MEGLLSAALILSDAGKQKKYKVEENATSWKDLFPPT